MPSPLSSPAQARVGTDADVNSIRRSWAQQTSLNLASEQEFPPMTSNTQPHSNNNSQHLKARSQSPSRIPSTQSPNILNYSCSSYPTDSRSSDPQSPKNKTPSTSLSRSNKLSLNLNRSRKKSIYHQARYQDNIATQKEHAVALSAIPCNSSVEHKRTHTQKGTKLKALKEELESAHLNKAHTVDLAISHCLVSTQQALASTDFCPVMTKGMLVQALANQKADMDTLMGTLFKKMEAIRQRQEKGLVHLRHRHIEWNNFLSSPKKISSKRGRGGIVENREEGLIVDASDETENRDEQRFGTHLGRGDSDNEDWYRKTSVDTTMDEGVPSLAQSLNSNFNIFGTISDATRSVFNYLQSQGISVTPVKVNEVTTKESKESNVPVEVEEVGTCPICDQVMLIGVLPQHASDCQGPGPVVR